MSAASLQQVEENICTSQVILIIFNLQLKVRGFLYGFEESSDCALLSSFCDDSNLHISIF